jgi:stearoyl-CoA desaturase (delta-9 desaturase)
MHRLLWISGIVGMLIAVVIAATQDQWMLLLISYIYFRIIKLIGFHIGLHRYFSHGSFKTGKVQHLLLIGTSVLIGQGSPISWASVHRHHHTHADQPLDVHSPHYGKWQSLFNTYTLRSSNWWMYVKKVNKLPRDLLQDPIIIFVHKYYYTIWIGIILAAWGLLGTMFLIFFVLAPVGFGWLHAPFINFFTHLNLPGSYRNYNTVDKSYNNNYVRWISPEEAYHNNHHALPANYNLAHYDTEFDPVAPIIKYFFEKHEHLS